MAEVIDDLEEGTFEDSWIELSDEEATPEECQRYLAACQARLQEALAAGCSDQQIAALLETQWTQAPRRIRLRINREDEEFKTPYPPEMSREEFNRVTADLQARYDQRVAEGMPMTDALELMQKERSPAFRRYENQLYDERCGLFTDLDQIPVYDPGA